MDVVIIVIIIRHEFETLTCREPAWESGHVGEFWCKASQNSRGAPLGLPERLPQNQNLSVLLFYDFHQLL